MSRSIEKISTLLGQQLPEFIRSDFPTFKLFLEAYYEFLEQDQGAQELLQNARSYRDIDTTVESFVQYFLKQYCSNIPESVLSDKRALVKHITDLYNHKGSEKSYKLLLRILLNKDVEFYYPNVDVLKASAGSWVQDVGVFLETLQGDPNVIKEKSVNVRTGNSLSTVVVTKKRDVIAKGQPLEVSYTDLRTLDYVEEYDSLKFTAEELVGITITKPFANLINAVDLIETHTELGLISDSAGINSEVFNYSDSSYFEVATTPLNEYVLDFYSFEDIDLTFSKPEQEVLSLSESIDKTFSNDYVNEFCFAEIYTSTTTTTNN